MNADQTRAAVRATVETVCAVADAVRAVGSVPSGVLYAQVMAHVDLATYNRIVEVLKNAKLVSESGHVLKWEGPKP